MRLPPLPARRQPRTNCRAPAALDRIGVRMSHNGYTHTAVVPGLDPGIHWRQHEAPLSGSSRRSIERRGQWVPATSARTTVLDVADSASLDNQQGTMTMVELGKTGAAFRSADRRAGKELGMKCRSWWPP